MTWAAVTREVSKYVKVSTATITGLHKKSNPVEGDGVLQMLLWLGRSPESFVPDMEKDPATTRLQDPGPDKVLRWDTN